MKVFSVALMLALAIAVAAAPAHAVTDAQIASIVVTANQVDVDAGKLAATKGSTDDVRKFGKLMVKDHEGVNKAAVELVTKLGVTPEGNPTSESLQAGGDENLKHLRTLKGIAFDRAYVDHEVAYHQQVIDALDSVLIPNAQNEELKALLVKVRPAFVAHLEHARQMRASLAEQ